MDEQTYNREETARIFDEAPFARTLGLEAVDIAAGRCESRIRLGERHLQQDGFVHAGVQAAMADHTAGAAAGTLLAPGFRVLTAEFKINLLRAARGETLRCVATVLKPGRTLIVAESEVHCAAPAGDERLVAKATVTLSVMAVPTGTEETR
ncbi:hypothetical protein KBTX_00774 [wastewater metagenome]|uniref:Thioesterase domain-containing protein n=2 Tax=unclassified sequences TaxID=12908 RepID=A0A5B8R6Y8_9ZZZZ|nr:MULTISPECIES: PaaI family thioesterase [Arhodomonas]MCS4503588.1 PaaI family thioesterase [Arhodomonas aquaeolei]QEA04466.1 hypothetical protein KBTEX_00774 [uncultured organism]